jgi:hypothetical protein
MSYVVGTADFGRKQGNGISMAVQTNDLNIRFDATKTVIIK